ncbi:hypothetical protein LMIY3S_04756 [Labrys miyagiensis]
MTERTRDVLAAIGWILLFFGLGSGFFRLLSISSSTWDIGYDAFVGDLWICAGLIVAGLLCVAPYFLSKR